MLNSSDTSRNRVTSFIDSDSEEKFEEPLMEEISDDDLDDWNFIIAQPKYYNKKQRLGASRDFPDGCGPYASRIVVPDNSFSETIESSLEDEEVATRTAKVVKCKQNAANAVTRMNKNKKRKCFYCARVPEVRDFPPLCGENGSGLISEDESLETGLVENYVEGDDDDDDDDVDDDDDDDDDDVDDDDDDDDDVDDDDDDDDDDVGDDDDDDDDHVDDDDDYEERNVVEKEEKVDDFNGSCIANSESESEDQDEMKSETEIVN